MQSQYTCSVIVPSYNRERFLPRCIDSVAGQDCIPVRSMQIIVIDDGSTDDTPALVRRLRREDRRQVIRYIRIDHIGEPGTVRNVGLEAAKGEFIAYCDSDDFWLPHHLATAMQRFKKNPALAMVSNYWALARFVALQDGNILSQLVVPPHSPEAVNTNCRVHRRLCVDEVGFFNTSRWGEDQDFFSRVEGRYATVKTGVVSSVNGYIKGGNNLTYEFDANVHRNYY